MGPLNYFANWLYPQTTPTTTTSAPPVEVKVPIPEPLQQLQDELVEKHPLVEEDIKELIIEASLEGNLNHLISEKTSYYETQAQEHLRLVEQNTDVIKSANRLQELLNSSSDKDQNVNLSQAINADDVDEVLARLKEEGFAIDPSKKVYTRTEKQDLVSGIEHRIQSCKNEITVYSQKCNQFMQMKSSVYEAAISIAKTLKELSAKIFAAGR